jgi:hypothetical protein
LTALTTDRRDRPILLIAQKTGPSEKQISIAGTENDRQPSGRTGVLLFGRHYRIRTGDRTGGTIYSFDGGVSTFWIDASQEFGDELLARSAIMTSPLHFEPKALAETGET